MEERWRRSSIVDAGTRRERDLFWLSGLALGEAYGTGRWWRERCEGRRIVTIVLPFTVLVKEVVYQGENWDEEDGGAAEDAGYYDGVVGER